MHPSKCEHRSLLQHSGQVREQVPRLQKEILRARINIACPISLQDSLYYSLQMTIRLMMAVERKISNDDSEEDQEEWDVRGGR